VSRLRRRFLSDRFFFLTVNLLQGRQPLDELDFAVLARSLDAVRRRQQFLLTAWVFLSDHWHAILCPHYPLTISDAMKSVKLTSTMAVNRRRGETAELWQGRFFDHALRTVRDYWDTVEYVRLNPVKRGWVVNPENWIWSSFAEYAGVPAEEQSGVAGWLSTGSNCLRRRQRGSDYDRRPEGGVCTDHHEPLPLRTADYYEPQTRRRGLRYFSRIW
jgi:putative transposase